jgi:hypothetical protein
MLCGPVVAAFFAKEAMKPTKKPIPNVKPGKAKLQQKPMKKNALLLGKRG